MCGRVISYIDIPTLKKLARIHASRQAKNLKRGYNFGPGSLQAAIISNSFKSQIKSSKSSENTQKKTPNFRFLTSFKWGISSESPPKFPKVLHFNLRIENVENLFKKYSNQRCVMVVDGYYEWKDSQPYMIRPKNGVLFLPACFKLEKNQGECGVLTCDSPEELKWLHHRAPCLLKEEDIDKWVDPEIGFSEAVGLIKKMELAEFDVVRVSRLVNSTKNDSKDCMMEEAEFNENKKKTGIERFFVVREKRKAEDVKGKEVKNK